MSDKKKKAIKKLIIDLDLDLHCEIKKRAAERNISMKKWIEIAVEERITYEKQYE
jgi:predicted HicB family RNase H-like nuclease